MAARATMANIILFVRDRIGDTLPAGSGQVFTDDQVQTALDATRMEVTPYEILIPAYSYVAGQFVWLDHYSRYAFWEDSPVLLDLGFNVLTTSATEPLREPDSEGKAAHFQFATSQISVRARGHSFDVWQVCANLLEERMAFQALNLININMQGSNMALNQTIQTWKMLIDMYRAKQRIGSVQMVRDDVLSQREYDKRRRIGITSADVPFIDGR